MLKAHRSNHDGISKIKKVILESEGFHRFDQGTSYCDGDVHNIFDAVEILTRENPVVLQNLTTASLLQENYEATLPRFPRDKRPNEDQLGSVKPEVTVTANTNASTPGSDNVSDNPDKLTDISIYDLLDDSFKSVLIRSDIELLKQSSIIKRSTTSPLYYVWRSKSLKSYDEGGRVGPLDSGKGRKSNWHAPFFGYPCGEPVTKTGRDALRVCCLICPNITTVQCVQSTMQRHLILKHETISNSLIQNVDVAKSDHFWRHIVRQAKYAIFKRIQDLIS